MKLHEKTRLFADDCILYRKIYNHDDTVTLQQDLDNLAAWEKMWGMQFHPEKCISLSVTRSQKPFHTSYTLKGLITYNDPTSVLFFSLH
jgi:hypothetical protein